MTGLAACELEPGLWNTNYIEPTFRKGSTGPSSFACYTDMDKQHEPHTRKMINFPFSSSSLKSSSDHACWAAFLGSVVASDWRLLQASSYGTLSMIPAASVEAFA